MRIRHPMNLLLKCHLRIHVTCMRRFCTFVLNDKQNNILKSGHQEVSSGTCGYFNTLYSLRDVTYEWVMSRMNESCHIYEFVMCEWLIRTCNTTHVCAWVMSHVWMSHVNDMPHPYMCYDSFIHMTWLIHTWHDSLICNITSRSLVPSVHTSLHCSKRTLHSVKRAVFPVEKPVFPIGKSSEKPSTQRDSKTRKSTIFAVERAFNTRKICKKSIETLNRMRTKREKNTPCRHAHFVSPEAVAECNGKKGN